MTANSPRAIIDDSPMGIRQWIAVGLTVCLNALDGFDVLAISFAAPGIVEDWDVSPDVLGWLLSMELVGMALGSLFLGGLADKFGRKPTILGCLSAMALGMFLSAAASDIWSLLTWRLMTGLGIGGLIAAINAVTAEMSNRKYRGLALSLMVIGYPIGGVTGGLGVQAILDGDNWREIFLMGAIATSVFVPFILFLLPETPAFLDKRRPRNALEKINSALAKLGKQQLERLEEPKVTDGIGSPLDLFKPAMLPITVLITLAYFLHITNFYFVLKWIPQIVVDLGFDAQTAALSLTLVSIGGVLGGACFGLLAIRFSLRLLTAAVLAASFVAVVLFGSFSPDRALLLLLVGAMGFFINGGIAGLYALFAQVFPTHLRATGTGVAVGMGRAGAALAPVLAGYLFASGADLQIVCIIMGAFSIIGAAMLLILKGREDDEQQFT